MGEKQLNYCVSYSFFIFLLKTVQRKTWDSLDYFCKKVAFILGYRTQFAVTLPLKTENEVLSLL